MSNSYYITGPILPGDQVLIVTSVGQYNYFLTFKSGSTDTLVLAPTVDAPLPFDVLYGTDLKYQFKITGSNIYLNVDPNNVVIPSSTPGSFNIATITMPQVSYTLNPLAGVAYTLLNSSTQVPVSWNTGTVTNPKLCTTPTDFTINPTPSKDVSIRLIPLNYWIAGQCGKLSNITPSNIALGENQWLFSTSNPQDQTSCPPLGLRGYTVKDECENGFFYPYCTSTCGTIGLNGQSCLGSCTENKICTLENTTFTCKKDNNTGFDKVTQAFVWIVIIVLFIIFLFWVLGNKSEKVKIVRNDYTLPPPLQGYPQGPYVPEQQYPQPYIPQYSQYPQQPYIPQYPQYPQYPPPPA